MILTLSVPHCCVEPIPAGIGNLEHAIIQQSTAVNVQPVEPSKPCPLMLLHLRHLKKIGRLGICAT